jgi:hypothetical protein
VIAEKTYHENLIANSHLKRFGVFRHERGIARSIYGIGPHIHLHHFAGVIGAHLIRKPAYCYVSALGLVRVIAENVMWQLELGDIAIFHVGASPNVEVFSEQARDDVFGCHEVLKPKTILMPQAQKACRARPKDSALPDSDEQDALLDRFRNCHCLNT